MELRVRMYVCTIIIAICITNNQSHRMHFESG